MRRNLIQNYQEQTNTNSHIEESDLSSISNPGTANKQISFVPADGSTVNLHSSNNIKIIQDNYDVEDVHPNSIMKRSEDAGIFPKIHAATVKIPIPACDDSPLQSADNTTARRNLGFEESPLLNNRIQSKQWAHTLNDMSEDVKSQGVASPEFQSSHEGKRKYVNKTVCDNAKINLDAKIKRDIVNEELSEDFSKIKVQLVQAQIQINTLSAQNLEMKGELEAYMNERSNLIGAFEEQRNHCNELEEHVILLEQQIKDPTQMTTLRGRALENAKTEIAQLKANLQAREKEIMRLEGNITKLQREQSTQGNSMFKQIKDLCTEVQRHKLLLVASTRQMQELKDTCNTYQAMTKKTQCQSELKNKEINELTKKWEEEKQYLLNSIKKYQSTIDEEINTKNLLETNLKELREKHEKQFKELNEAKEEIEQYNEHCIVKSTTKLDYADQISQIKDQFNKKLQALNEELLKAKDIIERKDCQIAECERRLQEDPLADLVEPDTALEGIKQILQVGNTENLQEKIEELMAESEECKLIKVQQEKMENALNESHKEIIRLTTELQLRPIYKNDEYNVEELIRTNEQLKESKDAMQIQLNNISETLELKGKEILLLIKSRDVAESNEKSTRMEMEKLSSAHHNLINLIDNIKDFTQFSFIKLTCPITQSMNDEEKIQNIENFNNYLHAVKEQVEARYLENIENISPIQNNSKVTAMNKILTESHKKDCNRPCESLEDSNEINKLKKPFNDERTHNKDILEQLKEMHKVEIAAVNASKNTIMNQLKEKVKILTDKLTKKKEKATKQLHEIEELLKKQEITLVENERLQVEVKELRSNSIELNKTKINIKELEVMIENMKGDLKNKGDIIQSLKDSLNNISKREVGNVNSGEVELKQKLEESEKALKLLQQRLLQSYEENTEKINGLKEKVSRYKTFKNKNKELLQEYKHMQELYNEIKTMQKNESNVTTVLPTNNDMKIDESMKTRLLTHTSKLNDYSSSVDSNLITEILKTLDSLIESDVNVTKSSLSIQLMERIERIRKITEQNCLKEIENLRRQIVHQRVPGKSAPTSLQGSIEQLRQSLTESEKATEESIQKRMLLVKRKVRGEIKCNVRSEEFKLEVNSKARELAQCQHDQETINKEELYCGTGRTISFGVPDLESEMLAEENSTMNLIIEEYKRKLEQQKSEEIDSRVKQIELIKKEFESKEEMYKKIIQSVQSENKQGNAKEMEDLLMLKEQEIKAKLNIENIKIMNDKKNELIRQYMENQNKLIKDFEILKQNLYNEIQEKTLQLEQQHQNSLKQQELEKQYKEKLDNNIDDIIKTRVKEIEDEYRVKAEQLEYKMQQEFECKVERQKSEFKDKYETKIEELQSKIKVLISEAKKDSEQFESVMKKAKEENELKCEQIKKKLEKELLIKTGQIQRKYKEVDEKANKLKNEYDNLNRKVSEEKELAIENSIKKYKEEIKILKEKHKAEVRNIKEMHKNELIKKGIEMDREVKRLNGLHREEIESLSKQFTEYKPTGIILLYEIVEEKKDNEKVLQSEKILQQKINALRKKLEAEYREKERSLKEETIRNQESSQKFKEQITAEYQQKLKQEAEQLKMKYKSKKEKLEKIRAEYEAKLRTDTNDIRDSNRNMQSIYESKNDTRNKPYDFDTSREELQRSLKIFTQMLALELDKLIMLADGTKASSATTADINNTIAKMMLTITVDGNCREYLESFKIKLNSVISTLKHSLEEQYEKKYARQAKKDINRSEDERIKEACPFDIMECNYKDNVLTKITPVMNLHGKYMVDIEKVVRDLLLVKDALYSVFQQAGKTTAKALEGTSCTILEEFTKVKETVKEEAIDNIAKHYRVLLNTILRFAVEATWVIKDGLKSNRIKPVDRDNEVLRLKLLNAELNEKLTETEYYQEKPVIRAKKYM